MDGIKLFYMAIEKVVVYGNEVFYGGSLGTKGKLSEALPPS